MKNNIYRILKRYEIIQEKEFFTLPLVHLCINYKTYYWYENYKEIIISDLIKKYEKTGLDSDYRIRKYLYDSNQIQPINNYSRNGNTTVFDEKLNKYVSNTIEDNDLPF